MPFETLEWEIKGNVAVLALNRPEKLNSFTLRMFAEIQEALQTAEANESVRAMVIKGNGKAFSAGGDMELLQYLQNLEAGPPLEQALAQLLALGKQFNNLEVPTIVAVRGYCLGVGLSLALLGDIRLASENAVFGAEFVAMGIIPDLGLLYTLPRLVGPARARELILTCRRIKAPEAERIGMVNAIVPDKQLEEKALQMAARIGAFPSLAVRKTRKGLNQSVTGLFEEILQYEIKTQAFCLKTEDHKEAVEAFLARRKPEFKGR